MNYQSLSRSNVLVMHPDPILCAGLVAALRQEPTFEVFVHGVDNLTPDGPCIDVVVANYDNAMRLVDPGTQALSEPMGDSKILVLTPNDREADIRRAIEAGVYGYVLVGGPVKELIDGVKTVASRLRYMSLAVAQRMAESLTRETLTPRETEVLRLVATGLPNKAVARQLSIEVGTVKSHMSAIMSKLGATSRVQAARIAVARGLVGDRPDTRPGSTANRRPVIEQSFQYA